jgi:bifunctional ADP-heptose synthase (sugar kinase/adenylyltransferase)
MRTDLTRTSQPYSGKAGLTVLGLFTIAVIAGQAEANLTREARAAADIVAPKAHHQMLSKEQLQKFEAASRALESLLALPIHIEVVLKVLSEKEVAAQPANSPLLD